jgi:hypothetical protein
MNRQTKSNIVIITAIIMAFLWFALGFATCLIITSHKPNPANDLIFPDIRNNISGLTTGL